MVDKGSLTIIFYTANRTPVRFMEAVCAQLLKAADGLPIISVSQQPMSLGHNICIGDIGQHTWNIYHQLLIGAKRAETDYIATAEDDILYSPTHYHSRLPSDNKFLYDLNRWSVYTWKRPEFDYRERPVLSQLLCERDLLISALEERFLKYPIPSSINPDLFGEPGRNESSLGLTVHELELFNSPPPPSITFNHEASIQYSLKGRRKGSGSPRVPTLEGWGSAEDILALYG